MWIAELVFVLLCGVGLAACIGWAVVDLVRFGEARELLDIMLEDAEL